MAKMKLKVFITEYNVKNKNNASYPVYSVTNSNGFCTEYFNKDVSSQDKRLYKIVPRGCFAYNPSRINVGSIDWQKFEDNVIVSPLYVVFKTSNKIDQEYLKYFFRSTYGKKLINFSVSGSVRANLKFDVLSEFLINVKTLDEQKIVAQNLNTIETIIKSEQKQLNLYDELIKSRFICQEVFVCKQS